MESQFHAFKRRFSTELVLTIVTGASLILATTMAGFVVLDSVNKSEIIAGSCFGVDGIDGTAGENGSDGATGNAGPAGEAGASATPGASGAAGTDGATGAPGTPGASGVAGTPGPTGSPGSSGTPGPRGSTGATGATGPAGTCDMSGDLVPDKDNEYSLGTAQFRWKSIQLGPGTIWMQDTTNPEQQVGMTITDGSLMLDGASALQIGNIRITATGMKTLDGKSNITIGDRGEEGFLAPANGIEFPDGSIQTTATLGGGGIPENYSETKICIEDRTNNIKMLTCEENGIRGVDTLMLIKK